MALQSPNECINNSSATAYWIVEASLIAEPFTEERGHRRCVRIRHRHATDQKTQEVDPMPQKWVLKVTINKGPKCSSEVTHRR